MMPVRAASLAVAGLILWVMPAAAQLGGIFGDPPRPSANVPGRPQAAPLPAPALQPPPAAPLQPPPAAPGITGIQTQPLPPPPGGAATPTDAHAPAQGQPAVNNSQSSQRAPSAAAPPADEVVTETPSQKIENPTAVFAGLDKITGRITAFDVALNETVQFGALQVTPRACYTRPPTEAPHTDGFIEVDEVTLQGEIRRIFTGWVFAASPGLRAVEHPIYDVWLTDCKGGAAPVAEAQPVPAPARPTGAAARPTSQRPPRPPAPQFAPR
jgi:hypothetical protein